MKNLIKHLLLAGFLFFANGLAFAGEVDARETVPLDNWRFALSEATNEPSAPNFDDSAWEQVSLPHTWNNFDGEDGGKNYIRGTGWYRTMFKLPDDARSRRVLLEFDAASRVTEVFVNGHDVGRHTGAFARFRFDVTDFVDSTKDNLLAVQVNNASNDIIPRGGDFTLFGGLYRKARVLLTSPTHIATLDYASPGIYLTPRIISPSNAQVEALVKLANDSPMKFEGKLTVRIFAADGSLQTSASSSVNLAPNSSGERTVGLHIEKPHLWNGVADTYLYRAVIELSAKGKVVDAIEQPLGLRQFTVRPDAGLFLNGQHLALHGVCRHQDRLDKGWAISTNDMAEDFIIIHELGANAIRLAHYQHDQFVYDLCDTGGVAVWAELCFVNGAPETDAGRANAKQQLRELIRQNFNHPSIFFWSIGNETSGKTNDAAAQLADSLLVELAAIVHEEDPTRLSTYASHHLPDDPRNFHTDVVAVNKYFGWYTGDYPDLGKWLDKFHTDHPERSVGISEYGAGASIYQHEENPPVRIYESKGIWHPEEGQAIFHEQTWPQIKARPWLWGTFIWNLFDFSNDSRAEGDIHGRNDKGLVTYDRQTRKDAFYWYQANWTTNPMVHITSKRFYLRSQSKTELKIYSNGDEVEAKLNGVPLGKKTSADHRFIWPDIELIPGPNRLEAVAYRGGKAMASDSGAWTYRADGDPLPNKVVADADEAARKKAEEKRFKAQVADTNSPAVK